MIRKATFSIWVLVKDRLRKASKLVKTFPAVLDRV